jgi:hypothetical protein
MPSRACCSKVCVSIVAPTTAPCQHYPRASCKPLHADMKKEMARQKGTLARAIEDTKKKCVEEIQVCLHSVSHMDPCSAYVLADALLGVIEYIESRLSKTLPSKSRPRSRTSSPRMPILSRGCVPCVCTMKTAAPVQSLFLSVRGRTGAGSN